MLLEIIIIIKNLRNVKKSVSRKSQLKETYQFSSILSDKNSEQDDFWMCCVHSRIVSLKGGNGAGCLSQFIITIEHFASKGCM